MSVRDHVLNARESLRLERAGLPSGRQNAAAIADLRRPSPPEVVNPPEIDSPILGGHAMADLLGALDDAGLINDQSRYGAETITGPRDDAVLPTQDTHTLIDGALSIWSDQASAWLPSLDPSLNSLIVGGVTVNGGLRAGGNGSPTFTVSSHAGSGASFGSTAGGDYHGEGTLTTGSSGISGATTMVQVHFSNALGNANYDVLFMPRNAAAANIGMYLAVRNTTDFTLGFAGTPTTSTAYSFSWWVVGR